MDLHEKAMAVVSRIKDDVDAQINPVQSEALDKIYNLIIDAVKMEFEDWETEIACAVYDPQRD